MSLPQPTLDVEPSEKVLSLRQKRQQQYHRSLRSARFRALGWELTGRLTVNLVLTLVALAALVKLVPYHQTQRQVLSELEDSVATLQVHNRRLRKDFTRYFDPAQTSQILQENGARESAQHIPIVWVEQLPEQIGNSTDPVDAANPVESPEAAAE
ncbi:slr1601 family putative cell division protein [Leptolyngbya iicbica]|uniref:Uncharacterized protein n=2 Tax=Cyanophyceae TaxID=3028117 RepID=A0A4Q7EFC3_9CYAN|nr:hypothetical protein [Leptolyngbya sp. LK]RZM81933.1 hypothetical protein DYY88_01275 [Leptolyngbya sp. LK]